MSFFPDGKNHGTYWREVLSANSTYGEKLFKRVDDGKHVPRPPFFRFCIAPRLLLDDFTLRSTLLVKASPGKVLNDVFLAVTT